MRCKCRLKSLKRKSANMKLERKQRSDAYRLKSTNQRGIKVQRDNLWHLVIWTSSKTKWLRLKMEKAFYTFQTISRCSVNLMLCPSTQTISKLNNKQRMKLWFSLLISKISNMNVKTSKEKLGSMIQATIKNVSQIYVNQIIISKKFVSKSIKNTTKN